MKPVAQAVAAARRWRFQTARLWLRWKPRLRWWSAAAAIGLVAALFTRGAEWAYSQLMAWTTWLPAISLLLAPLGIMVIVWVPRRLVPTADGSGIPTGLAAMQHDDDDLRKRQLGMEGRSVGRWVVIAGR